jgi:hypothetical protein
VQTFPLGDCDVQERPDRRMAPDARSSEGTVDSRVS